MDKEKQECVERIMRELKELARKEIDWDQYYCTYSMAHKVSKLAREAVIMLSYLAHNQAQEQSS